MLKFIIAATLGGAIGAGMGHVGKCSTGACPLTATPLRGGLYGAFMGVMFAVLAGGVPGPKAEEVADDVRAAGQALVVEIRSEDQFDAEVLKADKPVLVDMYASWCAPCQALAPTMEKLALDFDGRAIVAKVDIDKVPGLPKTYGVNSVPTVFIFHNGEVKAKLAGVNRSATYAAELEKLLAD